MTNETYFPHDPEEPDWQPTVDYALMEYAPWDLANARGAISRGEPSDAFFLHDMLVLPEHFDQGLREALEQYAGDVIEALEAANIDSILVGTRDQAAGCVAGFLLARGLPKIATWALAYEAVYEEPEEE